MCERILSSGFPWPPYLPQQPIKHSSLEAVFISDSLLRRRGWLSRRRSQSLSWAWPSFLTSPAMILLGNIKIQIAKYFPGSTRWEGYPEALAGGKQK